MFSCPYCRVPIQPGLAFCPSCNQSLTQQMGMTPPQPQQQPYPQQQPQQPQQGYPPRQFPEHTRQQKSRSSNKIMASILVIVVIVIVAFAGLILMKPADESNGDDGGNSANQKPVASISTDKTNINQGDTINFDSRDSDDPDGKIVKYSWNFDDGTTTTEKNPSYEFQNSGSYTIELTVTDNDGAKDVDRITISVNEFIPNKPPVASIYADKTRINEGETIKFESGGSDDPDGRIINYEWDFDDGSTSINANPSHEFQNSGSYTVKLTVFDDDEAKGTNIITISVIEKPINQPPIASIYADKTKINEGESINFDSSGSDDPDGTIVKYLWDFKDGSTSSEKNPNHKFQISGSYTVSLTVEDNDGATGTETLVINVIKPIKEPDPINIEGNGDDVTSSFELIEGISIFHMTHDGDSNIIIRLYESTGDDYVLLVNEIGEYDGSKIAGIKDSYTADTSPGDHYFEIDADGNWEITIEQPRPTSAPKLPRTYSGIGDDVPSAFMLEDGNVKFELSHDWDSNFIVKLYNNDGEYMELLVNEIGEYDGSTSIKVGDSYTADTSEGIHYLDITADGNWEVKMTIF